jgi:hypothetical protein
MSKASVTKVEILWSEFGPFEKFKPSFPSLLVADVALEQAARMHGPDGDMTYAKTGFRVTWDDGETYEGRIDVNRDSCSIAAQIRTYVGIYSGEALPPGRERAETDAMLDWMKVDRAEWKKFGESRVIG